MNNRMRKKSLFFLIIFPVIMLIPLYICGKMKSKYLFGELAYCLFIFDTILGLRPEWLERKIDLKTLYMIHGITAILAVVLAILHDMMSHLHGIAGLFGKVALYGAILITCLAVLFLSNQLLSSIPGINKIIVKIRKVAGKFKIDRELNVLFHSLAPLIVVFTFLHVCFIPKFNHRPEFMFFFVGYFVVFSVFYLYYGIYKKLSAPWYQIQTLNMLNDNTYQLVLEKPQGKYIRVTSGQFVFIHTPFSKVNEYHPFSVVSSSDGGRSITLGIKESGDFTQRLSRAPQGMPVRVKGAFGHFKVPANDNPIVMIAGGIGITPCLGMLESLSDNRPVDLIWSVRSSKEYVFHDQIRQLQKTHPKLNVIVHDVSQKGYLNQRVLMNDLSVLRNHVTANYFLCGPKPMMKSMKKILLSNNVPSNFILEEGFIF